MSLLASRRIGFAHAALRGEARRVGNALDAPCYIVATLRMCGAVVAHRYF